MAIYQHGETGRIVFTEGELDGKKYIQINNMEPWRLCDKCGNIKDNDFSNYCEKCRSKYHAKTAANYETRPYNEGKTI
jgi:Zn finger protein HypA/HybF involved in hydrogenase expression